ncbi:hypothetical protein M9H77_08773 [Catharanthus roseus]|uniref:Uncharacterized protein n=1 Tax=Catharanthus roseus TaxID=4058 RepID=A0ACC0BZ23_CATRO|nr:hypothetical protein M9H77_08773 [Catharanthus roseus]
MRRCLKPQCLHKIIPHHIHPVVWRSACLMRLDRMGRDTLPKPELSQNPDRHVRLDVAKIHYEPVPRGNPASPNLLSPVRCPQYLVGCHQIQSQSDLQQFIFILIT